MQEKRSPNHSESIRLFHKSPKLLTYVTESTFHIFFAFTVTLNMEFKDLVLNLHLNS